MTESPARSMPAEAAPELAGRGQAALPVGGRPGTPRRGLGLPLMIWLLGSALAVLAAGSNLRGGLALAGVFGLAFGWSAARRVEGSGRRRRRSHRA